MEALTESEMELARAAMNLFSREYRKANAKKFKEYQQRYWLKRAKREQAEKEKASAGADA